MAAMSSIGAEVSSGDGCKAGAEAGDNSGIKDGASRAVTEGAPSGSTQPVSPALKTFDGDGSIAIWHSAGFGGSSWSHSRLLSGSVAGLRPSQEISTAELSGEASRTRQIAPDLHRSFGFPDILEEGSVAVIAAPAAALEQLRKPVQPSLGKRTPAPEDIATTRHVHLMCHEQARKEKNGRDATQRNRINQA